jgi:uncharacterized repeat protein (TIGR03806 family)
MNARIFSWCLASLLALDTACGDGGTARDEPDTTHRARPSNLTCVAPPRPVEEAGVATERAFPNLGFNQPIHLLLAPGDDSRVFVVQKQGAVKAIANTPQVSSADTFIDLTSKVNSVPNEAGLLGMAFHPEFSQNGQVFLSYTTYGGPPEGLVSVVSRFRSTDGGRTLDAATEEVLLTQEKAYNRHNGGSIAFGPDGYLYIGFGDGGGAPDDANPAQDVNSLHGKLLRIDVDVPAGYGIPPGNPFASGGGRPEVFAWGFRNPWRFSFDRMTGELWVGDVGDESWEEVDRVVMGGNYGWPIREGSRCFARDTCASAGLIPPVAEYPHSEGASVTGGLVYRGSVIPSLYGSYFYADFVSGRFWALFGDPSSGQLVSQLLMSTDMAMVAFTELTDGEVLFIDMATGKLHRLVAAEGSAASSTFPQTLSATGCFEPGDPGQPVAGLIPYDVNSPLWSDGAQKERFLAVPDGKTIQVGSDGDWDFPEGSVLVKTFLLGGTRVETRLFMRHPDGVWAGYSYEWNDAQTDATLLDGSLEKQVAGRTWYFPSRAECLRCHTSAAGRTLGLETAQLNRSLRYPDGGTANQLAVLDAMGMFDGGLGGSPEALPRLAEPGGQGSPEARSRSYLHSNCSNCHRPGGPGGGAADLRFSTSFVDMRVCDESPDHGDLGIEGARLLSPGQPERSILSARMHALGASRMPPLASSEVDVASVQVVDAWIASLTTCR